MYVFLMLLASPIAYLSNERAAFTTIPLHIHPELHIGSR